MGCVGFELTVYARHNNTDYPMEVVFHVPEGADNTAGPGGEKSLQHAYMGLPPLTSLADQN